jgi:hypothetical protein
VYTWRGWLPPDNGPTQTEVPTRALVRLGYNGLIPTYCCHLIQAHGLSACEVRVEIPFDPTTPFKEAVISNDVDDTFEKMAHMALMTLCE